MSDPQPEHWRRWVEKAEHDRINAEHTLTLPPERCPYDTVVFHAQQCAEKYLKAVLVYHQIEFKRTHDLRQLAGLLEQAGRLPGGIVNAWLDLLNAYAVEVRYPDDAPEITESEAREAVHVGGQIRSVIRSVLLGHDDV